MQINAEFRTRSQEEIQFLITNLEEHIKQRDECIRQLNEMIKIVRDSKSFEISKVMLNNQKLIREIKSLEYTKVNRNNKISNQRKQLTKLNLKCYKMKKYKQTVPLIYQLNRNNNSYLSYVPIDIIDHIISIL